MAELKARELQPGMTVLDTEGKHLTIASVEKANGIKLAEPDGANRKVGVLLTYRGGEFSIVHPDDAVVVVGG